MSFLSLLNCTDLTRILPAHWKGRSVRTPMSWPVTVSAPVHKSVPSAQGAWTVHGSGTRTGSCLCTLSLSPPATTQGLALAPGRHSLNVFPPNCSSVTFKSNYCNQKHFFFPAFESGGSSSLLCSYASTCKDTGIGFRVISVLQDVLLLYEHQSASEMWERSS